MPVVFGFIHNETDAPAIGATVRVYDKDLRHEQLLGEVLIKDPKGSYEIIYTAEQFRRAEKKSADLIVRAFDAEGNKRAESKIHFNVSDKERIDLKFEPLPVVETPALTELEMLQQSIESIREDVAYRDFTDWDLNFLFEEIKRPTSILFRRFERQADLQHLGFLRLADQFFQSTDIPLAAFYGWFRQDQPQTLSELLDVPARTLSFALMTAISARIIPDISAEIPEILERIRSLRFKEGRLVSHRFVIQLINIQTDQPLIGLNVEVIDPTAETEDQSLWVLITDGRGMCEIVFSLPGNASQDVTRRLDLSILDDGVMVAEAQIEVRANQTEVEQLRLQIREDERTEINLEDISSSRLTERLRQRGITTIRDLFVNPDLSDDDTEELERLRATAKFALLAPEIDEAGREALLARGYRSPIELGLASRAEFVNEFHDRLGGDAAAYATYYAAIQTQKVLKRTASSTWVQDVTKPDGDPPDPDIPTGVKEIFNNMRRCGCKDCSSAVSPAAYLAHLLEWTLEHIKSGSASISLNQLQEALHQPFGRLPASCAAVEQQLPQVCICIEALWRYTGFLDLTILNLPPTFRTAYRHLRKELYKNILTQLGISFEQLRKATLQVQSHNPVAELVASQRQSVADILGIDERHLDNLFFDIERPLIAPDEETLERLFGFKNTRAVDVFALPGTPELTKWQQARLESIWQEQDWSLDAYSGKDRLPYVDPVLIDDSFLRLPLLQNPASPLLSERRDTLATHRQALVNLQPQQNGLAVLFEREFSLGIEPLRNLFATIQTGEEPNLIALAQLSIASLNLTIAGFTHLMQTDARLESGQPVGRTEEDIAAVWEAVFDIFSRAHRHSLFATWVEDEERIDLVFGPKVFWLPVESPQLINSWLAAPNDLIDWQIALSKRSSRPIVDPDQIDVSQLINFKIVPGQSSAPGLGAVLLWYERREWIDNRLNTLSTARQGQTTLLSRLQATLDASTLGIQMVDLEELAMLEAEGRDLDPRLSQLSLVTREYRFLSEIHLLVQGAATIAHETWLQADAILVQAEKRREFAQWRLEEQTKGIMLSPDRFRGSREIEPQTNSPQIHWLHDSMALEQWLSTLQAREDQLQAQQEGLAQAVGNAEEAVLPLLRNILIMSANAPGNSLLEKSAWLDKRLLIDMRMSGCQMTTRIGQAIETDQRLVRDVYTQEHLPAMQNLTLDAEEDYISEWLEIMASYSTWRANILAYLYPENLLPLCPSSRQSYGFTQLKENLSSQVVTPEVACKAAKDYSAYFKDVFNLEVQACCQVTTLVDSGKDECRSVTSTWRSLVHLFALAKTSGRIYTNNYTAGEDSKDTLADWRPVPLLLNVLEIIGAVPHETLTQQRFILLFAKVNDLSEIKLKFLIFDLDNNKWGGVKELIPPPGANHGFSAIAVQKRYENASGSIGFNPSASSRVSNVLPTLLAIRVLEPKGRVYVRAVNFEATDWMDGEWIPLYGEYKAEEVQKVCALVQRNSEEYLMIIQTYEGDLFYRIFSVNPANSKDDGIWRYILSGGGGEFGGAFAWPNQLDVYVAHHYDGKADLSLIGPAATLRKEIKSAQTVDFKFPHQFIQETLNYLENWLTSSVGVSLKDFQVNISVRQRYDVRRHDIHLEVPQPQPTTYRYSGSLLELLLQNYDEHWREKNNAPDINKLPYLGWTAHGTPFELLIDAALSKFKRAVSQIKSFNSALGGWKLADQYLRKFTDSKGIVQLLHDLLTPDKGKTTFSITFFRRMPTLSERETSYIGELKLNGGHIIASGGDEEREPSPGKAIVIQEPNGIYRLKLRRLGNELHSSAITRIAPVGNGPFDLTPLSAKTDLIARRAEEKMMYQNQGVQASLRLYVKEAYNLVPMYLGYQLQRNRNYEAALLWYRQVYDHLQVGVQRKIDYSLQEEESLNWHYKDAEEWLDAASNAHAIAATRKNTYTRHAQLMIIRCLVEYADNLFSHDNVSDIARARELYTLALTIMEELRPTTSQCENILGELEIDVVGPVIRPFQEIKAALSQIPDPNRLRDVVSTIKGINQNPVRPLADRLMDINNAVVSALNDIPASLSMQTILQNKRREAAVMENQFMAYQHSRSLLTQTYQINRQRAMTDLREVMSNRQEHLPDAELPLLPWLRQAQIRTDSDRFSVEHVDLTLFNLNTPRRLTVLSQIMREMPMAHLTSFQKNSVTIASGLSFNFCIPQNPVIHALRIRAENNLNKIRTCRNIAGFLRQLDPYGAPIGIGSGMVSPDGTIFSGIVNAPLTIYPYVTLANKAKELVNIAQQIESLYQAASERAEDAALLAMQAEQGVSISQARVSLQNVRLNQANSELSLAQLQKNSANLRNNTYSGWIDAGKNRYEEELLTAYRDAGEAQQAANAARTAAQIAGYTAQAIESGKILENRFHTPALVAMHSLQALAAAAEGFATGSVIDAQTRASVASFEASFERRKDEWQLQQGLAAADVQIGDQQVKQAQNQINIAGLELTIAMMDQAHAKATLDYLLNRKFDAESYRWIASVLEQIYHFFLQEATVISLQAAQRLAFERQLGSLKIIQNDYWNVPANSSTSSSVGNKAERMGLTGSARLLKDIYLLDNYAFDTRMSKRALTQTLDLREMFPVEFQRFRETGVLIFNTPLELVDRQMPGYYLCLIQQVNVSVVALIPPTYGIRATLTSSGISRVIVGGDTFQAVTIRNLPERLPLTASITSSSSVVELQPDDASLLRPFEGSGFDTLWELRMPKATNPFDYNSMATVLFTVNMTALHSFDYENEVIARLGQKVSFDRAYDFRQIFADAWYDLNNPDQTEAPMTVRFNTRRSDFPPNLTHLTIQHVVLYLVRKDGEVFEQPVRHLHFTDEGMSGTVGGPTSTVNGRVSTRSGNGTNWLPMIGLPPVGQWELSFPDTNEARNRFTEEEIQNILLVITVSGKTPEFPS